GWNEHRERDRLAVRRPGDPTWSVLDVSHLSRCALGVHPTDEDLCARRLALPYERDPCSIGRPPRVGALREEPIARAVGIHDPKRRLPAIVHLVDRPAAVDDLLPVRRDLWPR